MRKKRLKPTKVFLEGGTSDTDHKFLDIAPTMRSITHGGRKYFRCPRSQAFDETDGQWGMMYLWDGWGDWKLEQLRAKGAATQRDHEDQGRGE